MIALLTLSACDRAPSGAGAVDSEAPMVLVAPVEEGRFAIERRFGGQVRAPGEIRVVVREPGEVVEVPAPRDSQPVRAGQPLLRLRSGTLELEVREVEAQVDFRAAKLEREQRLFELGLVPQTNVEDKRTDLEQVRLSLERLKLRQGLLEVTAPASGVLLARDLPKPGQWCSAERELARIVDPESLVVEAPVPASWGEGERGVSAAMLELGDGRELEAEVVSLSAAADPNVGARTLTLRPAPGSSLVSGALVTVRLLLSLRERARMVPAEAVRPDPEGGSRVAVGPAAGEKSPVRWKRVVPGPSDGRRTVIESGLEPGAWVVVGSDAEDLEWGTYLGVKR